jgi:hypothetical protein
MQTAKDSVRTDSEKVKVGMLSVELVVREKAALEFPQYMMRVHCGLPLHRSLLAVMSTRPIVVVAGVADSSGPGGASAYVALSHDA